MRDKIIEELVWDDINVMMKDAESADFWYWQQVLKTRKPYDEWSDDELINELKEREINKEAVV